MKQLLVLTLITFLFLNKSAAQQRDVDSIVTKFDQHRKHAIQEKIYVHTDRSFYLTGETLWFKVYSVDGSFHKPLDVSKVAYLEILNSTNEPVIQGKIELSEGSGDGSFFLPASLTSGHYTLRAYTMWMNNVGPDYYFYKKITVVNPFIKPVFDKVKPEASDIAAFFPEGGNLVAGLKSKVAFKITDVNGKGIMARGALLNQQNDTVARFKPLQFGLGNFEFTPMKGEAYKAVIKNQNGKVSAHMFPKIQDTGYVMTLKDSGQFIAVKINSNTDATIPIVYLFVHARQIVVKAEGKFLQQNSTSFFLNKNDLPEGISQLTIFDGNREPICERLYFKQPGTELNINIQADQHEYGIRRKVALTLHTGTPSAVNNPASLSVAVYKVDSLVTDSPGGIFPYLWLSSDLNGTIEYPEYYFQKNDPVVIAAADNLMLTHGWRRFNWNAVLHKKEKMKYLPENRGHLIKGKVIAKFDTLTAGILTYLTNPSKSIRLYPARSNNNGEVFYEVKDLFATSRLILQTAKPEAYQVKLENPFSEKFSSSSTPLFTLDPVMEKNLVNRSVAMQVQDVYYYDDLAKLFTKRITDTVAFYGKADETYLLDDFTRFQVMEEVMREYVPGVFVRKRKDGFHFIVIDIMHGGVFNEDPMVLLDGVPILDIDQVMEIDPLKIKKLEVIKRKYYLGPATFSGVVSYSTYTGNLEGLKLDPNAVSVNYEGLQRRREFYSPLYENQKQRNSRMPDQRYLLYWNPRVTTSKDGSQLLNFYTSDVTGTYIIVAEGLTNDGISGSSTKIFSVKRFDN
jgi:hypothetical protein